MTWMPTAAPLQADASKPAGPSHGPSQHHIARVNIAGTVLRVIFLVLLVAITVRVSLPQNETLWTVYYTPGDVIRLLLGLAVCAWVGAQLFFARVPRDADGYRTWLYFGAVAVPFALICLVAVW